MRPSRPASVPAARVVLAAALLLITACDGGDRDPLTRELKTMSKLPYPETRRDEVVDDYHGTQVADPYRWLEDADSPETAAWVAAQNELTFGFLESIPARDRLREPG